MSTDIMLYAKMMKTEFPQCPLCKAEADYVPSNRRYKYECTNCGSQWFVFRKYDWKGRDKGITMQLVKMGDNCSCSATQLSLLYKPVPISVWKSAAKGEDIEKISGTYEKPVIEETEVKSEEPKVDTKVQPIQPMPTTGPRKVIGEKEKEKQKLEILWSRVRIIHALLGLIILLVGAFNGYLLPSEDGFEAFFNYMARGVLIIFIGEIGVFISLMVSKFWILGKAKRLV